MMLTETYSRRPNEISIGLFVGSLYRVVYVTTAVSLLLVVANYVTGMAQSNLMG